MSASPKPSIHLLDQGRAGLSRRASRHRRRAWRDQIASATNVRSKQDLSANGSSASTFARRRYRRSLRPWQRAEPAPPQLLSRRAWPSSGGAGAGWVRVLEIRRGGGLATTAARGRIGIAQRPRERAMPAMAAIMTSGATVRRARRADLGRRRHAHGDSGGEASFEEHVSPPEAHAREQQRRRRIARRERSRRTRIWRSVCRAPMKALVRK